jgi:hypothetical protein
VGVARASVICGRSGWLSAAPSPEHAFDYGPFVADLPIPELVENRRRSIAMLPPGAPALNRDEALELLGQLAEALRQLRNLKRSTDG